MNFHKYHCVYNVCMAIILKKDILKLQIEKKHGITLMVFAGILLTLIIVVNILWMGSYDRGVIERALISKKRPHDFGAVQAYVRMRVIFAIVGNTLVLGLFSGLVWWSISKRRLGIAFGILWTIIFIGNGIATPFYSISTDAWSIVTGVLNIPLAIAMIIWLGQLIAYRQRLKQEIARGKK